MSLNLFLFVLFMVVVCGFAYYGYLIKTGKLDIDKITHKEYDYDDDDKSFNDPSNMDTFAARHELGLV